MNRRLTISRKMKRCGNSLINRDDLFEQNIFGNERISPFDWKDEKHGFGPVFNIKNGFDCVIGNPPYIRIQEMNLWYPDEASLYKKIYSSGSKEDSEFLEKKIDEMVEKIYLE